MRRVLPVVPAKQNPHYLILRLHVHARDASLGFPLRRRTVDIDLENVKMATPEKILKVAH
jgi:hypothetical protein